MGFEKKYEIPTTAGPAPDWLPSWRDPTNYPDDLGPLGFAWQFLRRNPDYIADYEAFAKVPGYWPDGGGKTPKWSGRSFAPWAEMVFYHADPPALPGETLEDYERRMGDSEYHIKNLETHLQEKWGVDCINDPAKDSWAMAQDPSVPPHPTNSESVSLQYDWSPSVIRCDIAIKPEGASDDAIAIWFDPLGNIKDQLKAAKQILQEEREHLENSIRALGVEEKRKKAGGNHLRTLPECLRAYDAEWSRAERHEAANIIFAPKSTVAENNTKTFSDRLKSAFLLIFEDGYRDLLQK